jgi:hypothetical protein
MRYAVIYLTTSKLPAFLPVNYSIVGTCGGHTIICGEDVGEDTLDSVLIRLALGLYFGTELLPKED